MFYRFQNVTRRALSLAIVGCLIVSCAGNAFAGELSGLNTARRHVACSELSDAALAYYTGDHAIEVLEALPGASDRSDSYAAAQNNSLYDALRGLMQSTLGMESLPVYGGYGENSLAYYWNATDTSPDLDNSKSSHFLMFYSDAVYEYPGNTVTMNREHIWPKSHASYHESNGGADLHHLRPAVKEVNEAKSDHVFGYVDEMFAAGYDIGMLNSQEIYKAYADKDVFEPKDDVKGDVARILLYVYCCWGQPNLYSDVASALLPAADPDEVTNTGGRVIADLDTLLTWCEDDPVDTWEMQRNDLSQELQGNRNVFIDYPELAWKLFGLEIPAGIQTPTRSGCEHSWGEPTCEGVSCTEPGTMRVTCSKCGNVHKAPTPAPGHVDGDHNDRCDRCGTMLAGTYTLTEEVCDGTHVLLYHSASGKAVTPVVNSNSRLNGVSVTENEGEIIPGEDAAIFCLEADADGGFLLAHDGHYLTTPQRGGKLLWCEEPDDYSGWLFQDAGDGCFYIINSKAGNSYGSSAIEYFNNGFTTYSNPNSDAFLFRLYASEKHAWRSVSVVEPTPDTPGLVTYRCVACGETMTEEIPAAYPLITRQPVDAFVDAGEMARAVVEAAGEELRYQWYGRDPGQTEFWKSSLKGDTYSVKMTPAKSGREVYCLVTDKYGNTVQSQTATLSMAIPEGYELKITTQPESASVPQGAVASARVAAEGLGLRYQWYGIDPGQETPWKSRIKNADYSVAMIPSKSGRQVWCVVTDKYGSSITSDVAALTMEP